MRVTIEPFESIADSLYVKIVGLWNRPTMQGITDQIIEARPLYLVVDAIEAILSQEQILPIEETIEERRIIVQRLVALMIDNPKMIYLVINPNDNPALKSAKPYYEEQGIGDRYIFVADEVEALRRIKAHQAILAQDG